MLFNLSLIIFIMILYTILNGTKKKSKKKDLAFLRIVFILFFILVASREMTRGNDTQMYLRVFNECSIYKWSLLKTSGYMEYGYIFLNILISYISKSARFFLVVMAAIFNYSSYKFIKDNSKNYFLSCIMYIGLLFLYTSMTMMRQFTALSILLLGIKFAKEKKVIPFVLIVLFASLFHSSAYVALLYYPIYNIKYTKKKFLLIAVIGVIVSINIGTVFDYVLSIIGRVNYYSHRVGSDSISNFVYTIIYGFMFVFGLYEIRKNNKTKKLDKNNNFYLMSLLFATIINMLGINMNIMSRVALYFDILAIISIPNLISDNVTNEINRKAINILFVVFFVSYSSTIIYFKPEWNTAYNYKSCIFPKSGYICR